MHKLLPRLMEPAIRNALERFPVVILTGARQTGKSTLVAASPLGKGRTYRTLDDFDILERAREAPDFLLQDSPRLTIDEVQRFPSLLQRIKRVVDRGRRPGQFLLTGSSNLLLMRRVSETLAGRAIYLNLWPLTESEKSGSASPGPWEKLLHARDAAAARRMFPNAPPLGDWASAALKGGYPVAALASGTEERAQWFDGYLRTYLERDLQEVASIGGLVDFRRLMRLASLRVGKVLNQTDLARDAGLSQPTAHRYLNLLETSFQIMRIPPYAVSRTKRLVKAPKLYWTDVGLGAHLAGIATPEALTSSSLAGAFLENLVLLQMLAWRETMAVRPEILYWRTRVGDEVDFVIEAGGRLLPVEVKQGERVGMSDVRGLMVFLEEYRDLAPIGVVLYGGTSAFIVADRVLAVPLRCAFA